MTNETTATAASNTDTGSQSTVATTTAAPAATVAATETQQTTEGQAPNSAETAPATTEAATTEVKTETTTTEAPKTEAEKPAEAPKAPETYEPLVLADGVTLAPQTVDMLTAYAKANNLPQQAFQDLAILGVNFKQSVDAALNEQITQIREGWKQSSIADKEFGGDNYEANAAIAAQARDTFGSEAFKSLLKDSGVGDHPEFIRFCLNVGKAISPDTLVDSSGAAAAGIPQATGFALAASKLYGAGK